MMKNFLVNTKQSLKNLNLTQEYLAAVLGKKSISAVSKILNGENNLSVEDAFVIADALGTTVDKLTNASVKALVTPNESRQLDVAACIDGDLTNSSKTILKLQDLAMMVCDTKLMLNNNSDINSMKNLLGDIR